MSDNYSKWLLVSDIDGTLNNKMRKLPDNNKREIRRFVDNGGNFTLCSGRNLQSLTPHYKKLSVKSPAIFLNGAGIYDFFDEKMLSFTGISTEGMNFIVEAAKKFPSAEALVFTDSLVYLVNPKFFGYITVFMDKLDYKKVKAFSDAPDKNWGKVTFFALPNEIKKVKSYFESFAKGCSAFLTSPYTLEVVALGVNKGSAVIKLSEILGIDKENVAAIGDYYNDVDMLKAVSHPVCCGQAPQDIKDISEYVSCHCNKGAVADFINYVEKKYII